MKVLGGEISGKQKAGFKVAVRFSSVDFQIIHSGVACGEVRYLSFAVFLAAGKTRSLLRGG